jgi:hypothetical protein
MIPSTYRPSAISISQNSGKQVRSFTLTIDIVTNPSGDVKFVKYTVFQSNGVFVSLPGNSSFLTPEIVLNFCLRSSFAEAFLAHLGGTKGRIPLRRQKILFDLEKLDIYTKLANVKLWAHRYMDTGLKDTESLTFFRGSVAKGYGFLLKYTLR